ncbi:MAG: acyltransferase family protein [Aureliella sp.]
MTQIIDLNVPTDSGTESEKREPSTIKEQPKPKSGTQVRFHDLDALRAGAMLLGIVLHAALSFGTIPWPVKDSIQSETYDYLFECIHGFRMPLFFMLSGFFTAMLWRKRGLSGLVRQRGYRIGIPLFVSCLTIIPCMWAISLLASRATSGQPENPEVWEAIATGDFPAVKTAIESGKFDVNSSSSDGASALTVAVFLGHNDLVSLFINAGADVNQKNGDGGTALHTAAFVGRSDAAEKLVAAGADPTARDPSGQTPGDLLQTDLGTTLFLAGSFGLNLKEEELLAGRAEIGKQLQVDDYLGADGAREGVDLKGLYGLFFQLPVFMHLWFLSFLCWLLLPFAAYTLVSKWIPLGSIPRWLICSPLSLAWLVPLTMVSQSWMSPGVFGPDASVGLLPIPSVLIYYAVFFFFGVVYWEAEDRLGEFGRYWYLALPAAMIAVFPVGSNLVSGNASWFSMDTNSETRSVLANFTEATFAWLMIYGTIGLCRSLLSKENRTIRYVSDSSYWLYLTHLPLVLLAQYWVRDWDMSPLFKFVGVTVAVTTVLLGSYQLCVRHTLVGRVLHGPRQRHRNEAAGTVAA